MNMDSDAVHFHLAAFLEGRKPTERDASFDYCYNYFQSFREQRRLSDLLLPEHLEQACLEIGFYLASWGMLRGSSFLLQKSARHYVDLIKVIAEVPEDTWAIDVGDYNSGNISRLIDLNSQILTALKVDDVIPTLTLTTKVMLGVFGCIPAIDSYAFTALSVLGKSVYVLDEESTAFIQRVYLENKLAFDQHVIQTVRFDDGKSSSRHYTNAKKLDMVLFQMGKPKVKV